MLNKGFEPRLKRYQILWKLAHCTNTFLPIFACSAHFQNLPYSLFKSYDKCGSSTKSWFSVPLRTIVEKGLSIYFINGPISLFPAKTWTFNNCLKSFANVKIMSKHVFSLDLNKLISWNPKYEKGFYPPIYHCGMLLDAKELHGIAAYIG